MGVAENDRLRVPSGIPLAGSLHTEYGKEHRREPRYMATWRVALSIDGQNFHDGRLKDISVHGAATLSDLNVKPGTRITLKILVPSLDASCKSTLLVVYGKAAYTVLDTEHQCFRVGISFVEFQHASDQSYLEKRLANFHVKVADFAPQQSNKG